MTIESAEPMSPNTSIDYSPGGKATGPITAGPGFSADKQSFTVLMVLQLTHADEFLVTDDEF
ncbi:hypothetical protein K3G63_07565 [Hymenobacter sp. HSC-4F20]|uniref:hypothetical protein n=1 Tax=Hymenobacter sp. HSC-4F20 TaxID=2864135 RepID=UPI001C733C1E|nr:hypothetical protein [Hymenobacter sp. HSC-4F20]MBX0290291.1 hypothetical protein [Hymenobacter sp. HSC-4F20]